VGRSTPKAKRKGVRYPTQRFESLQGLSSLVLPFIGLTLVTESLVAYSNKLVFDGIRRIIIGNKSISFATDSIASHYLSWGFLNLAASAIAMAGLLVWMYSAHRNLKSLGSRGLVYEPSSTVVGWLIPIVNFYMPCLVMNEICRGSEPDDTRRNRDALLVGTWWFFMLSAVLAWSVVGFISVFPVGPVGLRVLVWMLIVFPTNILRIAALVLTGILVVRITRKQEAAAKRIKDQDSTFESDTKAQRRSNSSAPIVKREGRWDRMVGAVSVLSAGVFLTTTILAFVWFFPLESGRGGLYWAPAIYVYETLGFAGAVGLPAILFLISSVVAIAVFTKPK